MTLGEYVVGGFMAMAMVMFLFPVHAASALAAAALIGNLCPRIKWRKDE